LVLSSDSASAATTYLRPNADRSTAGWNIVGASTAWQALSDPVTQAETPTSANYIQTKYSFGCSSEALGVEVGSTSLAGVTGLTATAWFYTPDSTSVRLEIRRQNLFILGSGTFSSVGWHAVAFSPNSQLDLDDLSLYFQKPILSGNIGPRVYAAQIQLTYTAPSPKVYWGAWMDGDVYTKSGETTWPDSPYDTEPESGAPAVQFTQGEFQNHAGKAVSIVHFGQPAPWNQAFAAAPLKTSYKRGALSLLDMDPDGAKLTEIIEGKRTRA
jgi:hypothetical protein